MVHWEISCLIQIGMIPVRLRRGHSGPCVEAKDIEFDAGPSGHLLGNLADIQEAGAGRYAELQQRHFFEAEEPGLVSAFQNCKCIRSAYHEVKSDLSSKASEQRYKQRDKVEVERFGKALKEDPAPNVTVPQLLEDK